MSGLRFPKVPVDGTTITEDYRTKRAGKRAARDAAYAAVDRRDGKACRVCERFCSPDAPTLRADRHHVIPRSLCGPDESWNLVILCRDCHDERHTKGTLQLSGNADERDGTGRLIGIKVERLTETGWRVEKFC